MDTCKRLRRVPILVYYMKINHYQLMNFRCGEKQVVNHLNFYLFEYSIQDWAFLARFCFISGRGRYEYEIEFDRRYGEPKLLLYYDDKSQWPSVYKSDKVLRFELFGLSHQKFIHASRFLFLFAQNNNISGIFIYFCRHVAKG